MSDLRELLMSLSDWFFAGVDGYDQWSEEEAKPIIEAWLVEHDRTRDEEIASLREWHKAQVDEFRVENSRLDEEIARLKIGLNMMLEAHMALRMDTDEDEALRLRLIEVGRKALGTDAPGEYAGGTF